MTNKLVDFLAEKGGFAADTAGATSVQPDRRRRLATH
jgi:hypothetical protein